MLGIISLLLSIYTLLFFTRIAAIILVYTGLSQEIARFQARSAVTGCGFTTNESELITSNIVRRRVIANLMLVGNVGIIAAISSLLLGVVTVVEHDHHALLLRLGALAVGLGLLWGLSKSRWFERLIIRIFEFLSRSKLQLSADRLGTLCHLAAGYRVSELNVAPDSELVGKSAEAVQQLIAPVKLLGIHRNVDDYIGDPGKNDLLQTDDSLILYGSKPRIQELVRQHDVGMRSRHIWGFLLKRHKKNA